MILVHEYRYLSTSAGVRVLETNDYVECKVVPRRRACSALIPDVPTGGARHIVFISPDGDIAANNVHHVPLVPSYAWYSRDSLPRGESVHGDSLDLIP